MLRKYELYKYILRDSRLFPSIKFVFQHLMGYLFCYQNIYVYEMPLNEPITAETNPRIENFNLKIVLTRQQLDELVASGYRLGAVIIGAERKLDKGAMMFCTFIDKALAAIYWVAVTDDAKNSIAKILYPVDFSSGEAYLGWSETKPQYRRMRLSRYTYSEVKRFLADMGKTKAKGFIEKRNFPSGKGAAKVSGRVYAEARYIKILWWKSLKERPVTSSE